VGSHYQVAVGIGRAEGYCSINVEVDQRPEKTLSLIVLDPRELGPEATLDSFLVLALQPLADHGEVRPRRIYDEIAGHETLPHSNWMIHTPRESQSRGRGQPTPNRPKGCQTLPLGTRGAGGVDGRVG